MPFVNGDAFSNIGAGASGINNFFGQLLAQAQARQQMKDSAQRLAMQQQLAPYTMLRSLTYAKQAPALMEQQAAKAKELNLKTDPKAMVDFFNQVNQAFASGSQGPSQNTVPPGSASIPPTASPIPGQVQNLPKSNITPSQIAGINSAGQPIVKGSTEDNYREPGNQPLSPQAIQGLTAMGWKIPQTPAEQTQQKAAEAGGTEQAKTDVVTANKLEDTAYAAASYWSNLEQAEDILRTNPHLSGILNGTLPGKYASLSDNKDLGRLQTIFGNLQSAYAKNINNGKVTNKDLDFAALVKPDLMGTNNFNLGKIRELKRGLYEEYNQNNDRYSRIKKEDLPVKMPEGFKKYKSDRENPSTIVTYTNSKGETFRIPLSEAKKRIEAGE